MQQHPEENMAASFAVLNIVEILENILTFLARKPLVRATRTARLWRQIFLEFPALRKIYDPTPRMPLERSHPWIGDDTSVDHKRLLCMSWHDCLGNLKLLYELDTARRRYHCSIGEQLPPIKRRGYEVVQHQFTMTYPGDGTYHVDDWARHIITPPIQAICIKVLPASAWLHVVLCTVYSPNGVTYVDILEAAKAVQKTHDAYGDRTDGGDRALVRGSVMIVRKTVLGDKITGGSPGSDRWDKYMRWKYSAPTWDEWKCQKRIRRKDLHLSMKRAVS